MPDRVLRANILTSDPVNDLSWPAEIFYRRLMSIIDDYGRYEARASILRASLYALKLDKVSESDVVKWMGECSKAGLVRLYHVEGKAYLEVLKFDQRLRAMKSKFPAPADMCGQMTADDSKQRPESESVFESETDSEKKEGTPKGVGEAGASPPSPEDEYQVLEKTKKAIVAFIRYKKPQFIQPYVDLWNLFAQEKKLPEVTKISNARRRKFSVRIKETGFDFLEILKKAGTSEFMLTGSWFVFDWILESEGNYLKIIEGNYEKKQETEKKNGTEGKTTAPKSFNDTLAYLFGRVMEGENIEKLILPEYYDRMVTQNTLPVGSMATQIGPSNDEKKIQAVMDFFKTKKEQSANKQAV